MTEPAPEVPALFGIDPRTPDEVFYGWHRPSIRWNGWATPAFDRDEVKRIIGWVMAAEDDPASGYAFAWEQDTLLMSSFDGDERDVQTLTPDESGRYGLGAFSWTWSEIIVPTGVSLAAHLDYRNEITMVHVRANNVLNDRLHARGVLDPGERRSVCNRVAANAVEIFVRLRPRDPDQILPAGTATLIDGDQVPRTWTGLDADQREKVIAQAVDSALEAWEMGEPGER